MATLVQSPAGVTSTGTGSVAPTCTAASAGNTLVVKVAWNTTPGQTDINIPAGWTASALADIDNTNNVRGRILKKVAAGGETGVTITTVTGTPDMAAFIEEWSGADASASEDTMRSELSGSTAPPGTGAIASPGAGDFATGFIAIKNNNALNTPTNGYTLVGTAVSGNATAANQVRLASLYNVAPGATDVQLTEGGTARPFIGQLTTILPAAGLTLSATAGRLDISATAPTVKTSFGLTAGRLDISATGPTFTISLPVTAGVITLSGTAPAYSTSLSFSAIAGRINLIGGTAPAFTLPTPALVALSDRMWTAVFLRDRQTAQVKDMAQTQTTVSHRAMTTVQLSDRTEEV